MLVEALQPVGAAVSDLAVDALTDDDVDRLVALLAEHGALVLAGQHVDDATFVAFLRRFGDLTFTAGERPVPGFEDLNVVSNIGRSGPPRSTFHTDTSYVRHPPAYTALRAVQVPERGGATLFTNQYRAFDTLAEQLRMGLQGRTITHVVTGLDLGDDEQAAEHPAFRRHPVSGRTSLFLSAPARCQSISDMDAGETRAVIDALFRHSTAPDNVYCHEWSAGDVVMWDNRCVMHRADHADVIGDRVMHRGMVASG